MTAPTKKKYRARALPVYENPPPPPQPERKTEPITVRPFPSEQEKPFPSEMISSMNDEERRAHDQFASMAMEKILLTTLPQFSGTSQHFQICTTIAAQQAFQVADAMLVERRKR